MGVRVLRAWVRAVAAGGAVVVATVLVGACAASPPGSAASPGSGSASGVQPAARPLTDLADLAVRRLLLSDKVAEAKFGTPQPIDDPPRERQVLEAASAASPGFGLDPAASARFFGDQIEASKVVQRGLYADWTAHPRHRPAARPDLAKEVRPQLDQITSEILQRLRDSAPLRHGGTCRADLPAVTTAAAQPLDALHRQALDVALRSVCSP